MKGTKEESVSLDFILVTVVVHLSGLSYRRFHTDTFTWFRNSLPSSFTRQVSFIEESGKQYEVREVHRYGKLYVELGYVTGVRRMILEVVVCPNIDSAANYHLRELKRRDNHGKLFWWEITHTSQSIVRIHETVNTVIHNDKPARRSCVFSI